MPLKHSCFISYRRGHHPLTRQFIKDLKEALESYIEPYTDKDVYIDEHLEPGTYFSSDLAEALCESACLIMVFTPKYFDIGHTFCAREYKAMEKLEESRLASLRRSFGEHSGLIIPIVFRGFDHLPVEVKTKRNVIDLSGYTLAECQIAKNPRYIEEIERIARKIFEICRELEALPEDPCCGCAEFEFPSEAEILEWLRTIQSSPIPFPGR